MDDASLRRHLTAVRRLVLDIVHAEGEPDRDQVAAAWLRARPSLTAAHATQIPRMVGEVLWRLTNLGWIERTPDGFILTPLGEQARTLRAPAR